MHDDAGSKDPIHTKTQKPTILKFTVILATTLLQTNGRQQSELDATLLQLTAFYVMALPLDTEQCCIISIQFTYQLLIYSFQP